MAPDTMLLWAPQFDGAFMREATQPCAWAVVAPWRTNAAERVAAAAIQRVRMTDIFIAPSPCSSIPGMATRGLQQRTGHVRLRPKSLKIRTSVSRTLRDS